MIYLLVLLFPTLSFAQGSPPQPSFGVILFQTIPYLLVGLFGFYYLVQRPESEKERAREQFLSELKKGSKVLTSGGIIGVVTAIDDGELTVEIAPKVKVKVSKKHVEKLPS